MKVIDKGYQKMADKPSIVFVGAFQQPSTKTDASPSTSSVATTQSTEQFDIAAEADSYFDDSSLSKGAQPRIVILMGGVGAAKPDAARNSTRRVTHWSTRPTFSSS